MKTLKQIYEEHKCAPFPAKILLTQEELEKILVDTAKEAAKLRYDLGVSATVSRITSTLNNDE